MGAARFAWVVIVVAACRGPARTERVVTVADTAPPPITRCGDLATDSIAGIRLGLEEAAVLRAMGPPTEEAPPKRHFDPNISPDQWFSAWGWESHDLALTWVARGDRAPRTVYSVAIGPRSDLATSCGVRIGATRADVERAYQDAIALWRSKFAQPAEQGFITAPSGQPSTSPLVLVAGDTSVLGLVELDGDRVATIALVSPAVLFEYQW